MVSGAGGSARNCSTFGVRGSREIERGRERALRVAPGIILVFRPVPLPLGRPTLCSSRSYALAITLAAQVHDDGAGEDQDVVLGVGDLDGVGFRGLVPAAGDV